MEKVFQSTITRDNESLQNDLYSLINIIPASPKIQKENVSEPTCDFKPKMDKHYVPKKNKKKSPVKTVRDIRNIFEQDVYAYLPKDLEKQHNVLLRKITDGSAGAENTKTLANNLLKSETPISRNAWQMVMNLNPERQTHCMQYVLWNGKYIRVNGSKGGKNKLIWKSDIAYLNRMPKNKALLTNKAVLKRKGLLLNSLSIKFKPGPLTQKMRLDDSYQKFNFAATELVNLPKPALFVQPKYGVCIEPSIANILHSFRDLDGTISKQWAEFAVSVLGKVKNSNYTQNEDSSLTFNLNYSCNQDRLLMRPDFDNVRSKHLNKIKKPSSICLNDDPSVFNEVKAVINDMIDTVDISLNQDNMYMEEIDPTKSATCDSVKIPSCSQVKERLKKKCCELNRLDVTVIRLPDDSQDETNEVCQNMCCRLGCVCSSLMGKTYIKEHCGRTECMFQCKCDFSTYENINTIDDNNLIPGLLNLSNEMNLKLAKEEQKFHQTVVMTGEKSIVLKSEKRNCKVSKRYADFLVNDTTYLKSQINKANKSLSVVSLKLNCENIEPWCMVHNLYKCFCKGKIVEKAISDTTLEEKEETEEHIEHTNEEYFGSESEVREIRETKVEEEKCVVNLNNSINLDIVNSCVENSVCARTTPYKERKYVDSYYINTNKKILKMEMNDTNLHKKMMTLRKHCMERFDSGLDIGLEKSEDTLKVEKEGGYNAMKPRKRKDCADSDSSEVIVNKIVRGPQTLPNKDYITDQSILKCVQNDVSKLWEINSTEKQTKTGMNNSQLDKFYNVSNEARNSLPQNKKFATWVETSYKQYKERFSKGNVITSLEPPRRGTVVMYPWDFILSRYRERKNLFLITGNVPHRILLAVDRKHPFFKNCINIDDIRFADLNKYPTTVKNLLTNATDSKDNFCILYGLPLCWELIGAMTKTKGSKNDTDGNNDVLMESIDKQCDETTEADSASKSHNYTEIEVKELETSSNKPDIYSRWFFMTIENDFSEIQFFNRGFFVKYESIITAINVARMSGKTVRLSSPQCASQFGVYATSNLNQYCVFVGPYKEKESLGIEKVKTRPEAQNLKRTRGVWITTKNIDNPKVIDNPHIFMPSSDLPLDKFISLDDDTLHKNIETPQESLNITKTPEKIVNKIIKPIKIRKTDGFYQFTPNNVLRPTSDQKQQCLSELLAQLPRVTNKQTLEPNQPSLLPKPIVVKKTSIKKTVPSTIPFSVLKKPTSDIIFKKTMNSPTIIECHKKPIAEIAPQIKIVDVYSESVSSVPSNNIGSKGNMFILKPEEINNKVLRNRQTPDTRITDSKLHTITSQTTPDHEIDTDIENFLANSIILQKDDIFEISDEDGISDNVCQKSLDQEVWIECKNIENLGWIRGKIDFANNLSFEFPGFKFTDFYSEGEAFNKINQVMSRKVYVPRHISLEWHVVTSEEKLKTKHMLKSEELGLDFVLTRRGLRHKRDVLVNCKNSQKSSDGVAASTATAVPRIVSSSEYMDKASDLLSELEDKSKTLDDINDQLLSAMRQRKDLMFRKISSTPEAQQELQNIMTDACGSDK